MADVNASSYVASLFKDGLFTDFVVECGGYSFAVHKSYLFPLSGYFRILLSSQMKEVTESKVTFDDIDPSLVTRLLVFCYNSHKYPEVLDEQALPTSCNSIVTKDKYKGTGTHSFLRAELALDLIDIADRFDVPKLREEALTGFKAAFSTLDESGTAPQAMLNRERCMPLVKRMYNVPVPLRDLFRNLVLTTLKRHSKRGNRDSENQKLLEDMIRDIDDLRDDVIKDYMKPGNVPSQNTYKLKLCGPGGVAYDFHARNTAAHTAEFIFRKYAVLRSWQKETGYVVHNGRKLEDSFLIDYLGLEDGATLEIVCNS